MDNKGQSVLARIVENKNFCIGLMIFALVYDLFYSIALSYVIGGNPITHTISMIGRATIPGRFPTLYVFFGIVTNLAFLLNINYAYHKDDNFESKIGKFGTICSYIGVGFLTMCTLIPSIEFHEVNNIATTFQVIGHWSGALLFGVFFAISLCLYLLMNRKKYKGYLLTFILLVTLLAAMIVTLLLIPNHKNGVIEILPIVAAMVIVILINTELYPKSNKISV